MKTGCKIINCVYYKNNKCTHEGNCVNDSIPTDDEIMEIMEEGYCTTPDGCVVEPDGTCPHGQESWAIMKGLI